MRSAQPHAPLFFSRHPKFSLALSPRILKDLRNYDSRSRGFLFASTKFYFSHREVMPQCASLLVSAEKIANQVIAIFKKHSYFRHPKNVSYRAFLLFGWQFLGVVYHNRENPHKRDIADLAFVCQCIDVIAILMMLANCVLAIFQPRYTLPMWELTLVSLSILFGGMMELCCIHHALCILRNLMIHKTIQIALKGIVIE